MKMMKMVMAEVVVMMVKRREKNDKSAFWWKKGKNDGDEYDQGDNDTWKRWQQVSGYKEILQYMVLCTHTFTHTQTYALILVVLSLVLSAP